MTKKLLLMLGGLALAFAPMAGQAWQQTTSGDLVICHQLDPGLWGPNQYYKEVLTTDSYGASQSSVIDIYYTNEQFRYETMVVPGPVDENGYSHGVLTTVNLNYSPQDIIPPNGVYDSYSQSRITASRGAQNWDKRGQAIWYNNCTLPTNYTDEPQKPDKPQMPKMNIKMPRTPKLPDINIKMPTIPKMPDLTKYFKK